jgi:hypothetical protein
MRPTVAGGSVVVVIETGVLTFTVRLNTALTVAGVGSLSVTCTVNVEVPSAVAVPVMAPRELSVNPAGKVPAVSDQVYGPRPPVAESVALYIWLTTAAARVVVVTDSGVMLAIVMVNLRVSTAAVGV